MAPYPAGPCFRSPVSFVITSKTFRFRNKQKKILGCYSAISASRLVSDPHLLSPNSFRNYVVLPAYAVSILCSDYLWRVDSKHGTRLESACVYFTERYCAAWLKYISHLHIYRKNHIWSEMKRKLTFQGS